MGCGGRRAVEASHWFKMSERVRTAHGRAATLPFQLVAGELRRIEAALRQQVKAFDPGVEPYVAYVCDSAGKRIRPALSVMVGGATGGVRPAHLKLGTILELIHVATLVHDDIIDGAATRRKAPTASSKWGAGMAVLLGDALFSHALMMSTEFDNLALSRGIAAASRAVCEGEILQTQRRFDLTLTKRDYFRMIEMKTGALFAASTELSALLSESTPSTRSAMRTFGLKLGTAYQIYDDCLDLIGSEEHFGKTLRTDLEKGKLTLPILNLLENASHEKRARLQRCIINQETLDLPVLVGIADYGGAIARALDAAARLLADARSSLACLPNSSRHRDALAGILSYLHDLLRSLSL